MTKNIDYYNTHRGKKYICTYIEATEGAYILHFYCERKIFILELDENKICSYLPALHSCEPPSRRIKLNFFFLKIKNFEIALCKDPL